MLTSRPARAAVSAVIVAIALMAASAAPGVAEVSTPPLVFPVEGTVSYTDTWGACRGTNCERSHEGTDIMGKKLQRLIASADSTVTYLRQDATRDGSRGNMAILRDQAGWEYWYVHVNNDSPGTDDGANPAAWRFAPGIEVGAKVRAGQHIGYLGDSGNAEGTAPHLHFELHMPDGTVINPYDALRSATRFVLDDARPQPLVTGDVDGDGRDEVMHYLPGSTTDERFDVQPGSGIATFARTTFNVSGTYQTLSGDFDANGYDDILWYAAGSAADYLWMHGPDGRQNLPRRIHGTYRPLVGDFDANGYDDILWYAAGSAADYYWWHGADGMKSVRTAVHGTYEPVTGDLDGNGFDDILWYAPGAAKDYLWSHHAEGFTSQGRTINGRYQPTAGDVDGNGMDDIYWYAPGTAGDYLWRHTGGAPLSTRHDQDDTLRVDAADLDGDGRSELVWFGLYTATPDWVWSYGSGTFAVHAASTR